VVIDTNSLLAFILDVILFDAFKKILLVNPDKAWMLLIIKRKSLSAFCFRLSP